MNKRTIQKINTVIHRACPDVQFGEMINGGWCIIFNTGKEQSDFNREWNRRYHPKSWRKWKRIYDLSAKLSGHEDSPYHDMRLGHGLNRDSVRLPFPPELVQEYNEYLATHPDPDNVRRGTLAGLPKFRKLRDFLRIPDQIHLQLMAMGEPADERYFRASPWITNPYYQIPDDLEDVTTWNFAEGLEMRYGDDTDYCCNCYKYFETQPTSYGWTQPYYDFEDGERVCENCLPDFADDYFEEIVNNPQEYSILEPGDYGWARVDVRYENGMHPGQNDDPEKIVRALNAHDIDVLFTVLPGQFDINFWAWVKEEYLEQATEILSGTNTDQGYNYGDEVAKVLRGERSEYIEKREYHIPQEEFIKGIDPDNLPDEWRVR